MQVMPNTTTTDTYPQLGQGGAQLGIGDTFASGYIVVANASVFALFQSGLQGQQRNNPELFLTPGTYPLSGSAIQPLGGIRFRSAVLGTPAQVFGVLYKPNEASLLASSEFTSQISTAGNIAFGGPFQLIDDQTLLADTSSISFLNIPQTFKHLFGVVYAGSNVAGNSDSLGMRLNNDSGANYDVWGFGQTDAANTAYGGAGGSFFTFAACPGNPSGFRFAAGEFLIPNYRTSNWKSIQGKGGAYVGAGTMRLDGHCNYLGGGAVTRIQIFATTGPLLRAGSRFTLYGMN